MYFNMYVSIWVYMYVNMYVCILVCQCESLSVLCLQRLQNYLLRLLLICYSPVWSLTCLMSLSFFLICVYMFCLGYQENEPAVSVDSYVEYSETPGALFPDPPPLPPDVVDIDNEVQQSEQTHPHGYGAESDTSSSLPQLMNEQSMDAR